MRKAFAVALLVTCGVICVSGWVCVLVIAYRNTSPVVIESCPAPRPTHLPSVRP